MGGSVKRAGSRAPDPVVLMYHGLDPGDGRYDGAPPEERAYVIAAGAFRAHLRALAEAGRRIVDPREFLSGEGDAVLNPGDALLTFDDNDLSHYDTALPMLRDAGLKAVFFVATGLVGQPGRLDWPRLREMADAGMSIGAHGHTHQLLTSLGRDACKGELEASRATLRDQLGLEAASLAFPGGRLNRRVLHQARASGCRTAFASAPFNSEEREGVRLVGRVPVRSHWTATVMADFLAHQESRLRRMRRVETLRRAAQTCLGPVVYRWLHCAVWRLRGPCG